MRTVSLVAAFATVFFFEVRGVPSGASGSGDLEGTWFVGPDLYGETEEETHFFVWLEGDGAKSMYDMLDVPAVEDDCTGDGTLTKLAGPIQCSLLPDGTHLCYLGVDVAGRELTPGVIC